MCEQISSWLGFAWVRRNGGSCKPWDSVSVTVRQPWSASRPGYALNELLSQINMWSVVISAFGSFLSERSLLNSECSTGLIIGLFMVCSVQKANACKQSGIYP